MQIESCDVRVIDIFFLVGMFLSCEALKDVNSSY